MPNPIIYDDIVQFEPLPPDTDRIQRFYRYATSTMSTWSEPPTRPSLSAIKALITEIRAGYSFRDLEALNHSRHPGEALYAWIEKMIGRRLEKCALCYAHMADRNIRSTVARAPLRVCFSCYNNSHGECWGCGVQRQYATSEELPPPNDLIFYLFRADYVTREVTRWVCLDCWSSQRTCTQCGRIYSFRIAPSQFTNICLSCYQSRAARVIVPEIPEEPPRYYSEEYSRQQLSGIDEEPILRDHSANVILLCPPYIVPPERKKDPIRLGIELEVECVTGSANEPAKEVWRLLKDFAIIKHDGSLSNGFEIVTVPADLESLKEKFELFLRERPKSLRSFDTGRCGMHIHIGREGMSWPQSNKDKFGRMDSFAKKMRSYLRRAWDRLPTIAHLKDRPASYLQIWRMWKFFMRKDNLLFCKSIAQRPLDRDRGSEYMGVGRGIRKASHIWSVTDRRYRYGPVNPLNKNTVELRIFQGTLHFPSFAKNLEFAHAFTRYTKPSSLPLHQVVKYDNFIKFVKEEMTVKNNQKVLMYPYLHAHLVAKGFIEPKAGLAIDLRKEQ